METSWGYVESEQELTKAYAMKGDVKEELEQVTWKEAKYKHKRMIVLADPGMGKTTLLKMEALTIAQEERNQLKARQKRVEDVILPLFIRFSDLSKTEGKTILDVLLNLIKKHYDNPAQMMERLVQQKIEAGKCLLLFDALDEVPKMQRNELLENLRVFARNVLCPIIGSSRIVGYGGQFIDNAKEVEIVPFNERQKETYIETWFKNTEILSNPPQISHQYEEEFPTSTFIKNGKEQSVRVTAQALICELRQKPQIQGLAQNPLLLSLLCSLYQENMLTLPTRRVEVYEHAVEYMLDVWSRNRKPHPEGRIRAKIRLLETLAYQFSCQGKEIFTADDLYDRIEAYLCSAQVSSVFKEKTDSAELITELTEEDGIIPILDGKGKDSRYIFLHRTFQEYFTASYLNRQSNGIELAKTHFWDFDWHETIALFAGLMNTPELLLQMLTKQQDDIFSTLLLLAGRCLAECQEQSDSYAIEIFERIYNYWISFYQLWFSVHDFIVTPDTSFVKTVLIALGQAQSYIIQKLQIALHDNNEDIRNEAIEVLKKIGNSQVVDVLLTILTTEEDNKGNNWFRKSIIDILGEIGDPRAVEVLLAILAEVEVLLAKPTEKENEYFLDEIRSSVIKALGNIRDLRAFKALLRVAFFDEKNRW